MTKAVTSAPLWPSAMGRRLLGLGSTCSREYGTNHVATQAKLSNVREVRRPGAIRLDYAHPKPPGSLPNGATTHL